jgi:hypothetical protein
VALVTVDDLNAFETRLGVRLGALEDRLDHLEQQSDGILSLMQAHGLALGELHALLPQLIVVTHPRPSRPAAGPPTPRPSCDEAP